MVRKCKFLFSLTGITGTCEVSVGQCCCGRGKCPVFLKVWVSPQSQGISPTVRCGRRWGSGPASSWHCLPGTRGCQPCCAMGGIYCTRSISLVSLLFSQCLSGSSAVGRWGEVGSRVCSGFPSLLVMVATSPCLSHCCAVSALVTGFSCCGYWLLRQECCFCSSYPAGCGVRAAARVLHRCHVRLAHGGRQPASVAPVSVLPRSHLPCSFRYAHLQMYQLRGSQMTVCGAAVVWIWTTVSYNLLRQLYRCQFSLYV